MLPKKDFEVESQKKEKIDEIKNKGRSVES